MEQSLWVDVRNQIRKYSVIHARPYEDTAWEQHGGHKITVGDVEYEWRGSRNGEYITYRFGNGAPECALLLTDRDSSGYLYGILQGVRKGVRCSASSHAATKDLLLAIWKLAYQKKLRYLELSDDSKIICQNNVRVSLSELYFIAHEKTWYETILPIFPSDPELIEGARELVRTSRWVDVYNKLSEDAKKQFLHSYAEIDSSEPGSTSAVIRYLKTRDWCSSIGKYDKVLVRAIGIHIHDVTWRTVDITGPVP